MMRTSYDPDADAFYAQFAPEGTPVVETREVSPGVMIDVDADGSMVGIEVLSVRTRGTGTYSPAAAKLVNVLVS